MATFQGFFGHFWGPWIRGEFLRWFPPYMFPPYPFGASAGSPRRHFPKKTTLQKRTTVLQFGTFSRVFLVILGSLMAASPRGGPEACPRRPQGVPKASPRRPKGVPRRPKGVPKASKGVQRRPKASPRRPKGVPRCPKSVPKASKGVPMRPKASQRRPKDVQRRSRGAPM